MSILLKNAPVYYALAQAKFNPVAAMAKFSVDIQERMRRAGYTIFETEDMQNIDFGLITDSANANTNAVVTTTRNWFFTKPDRTCGYVLTQDFLTFHTTGYLDRDQFFKALCDGLEIVHEIVQLEQISRLGIRYLNAVIPGEGEYVKDYLNSNIQGVTFGLPVLGGIWEAGYRTQHGLLIAKVYQAPNSPLGFPQDLVPRSVQLLPRFKIETPFAHAVIDMDLAIEGAMPINCSVIYEKLLSFHGDLAKCFHAIATPLAFERWA
ncbi:TIGR04255 family protein [Pseudomonas viridiflava]|uniref:TIGR04255 family protein n=1 Tax=Pseudomonas viridiflava TaxID=33069 RepID=UPI000F02335F|nr:TIGR04255 family protein [Pseudomonas viridiflava]